MTRLLSMDESTWPVDVDGVPRVLGLFSRADLDGIKHVSEQQERLVGGHDMGFQDAELVGIGDRDGRIAFSPVGDLPTDRVAGHLKAKLLLKAFAERHGVLLRRGGRS